MAHHHHAPGHGEHRQGHEGPGHDHEHLDWAELAPLLESQAELFTPLYEHALSWLAKEVTEPGLIVDAGSGPGVISGLFAETFPGARIVAVDGSEPLLERARARAERIGAADRFATLTGDMPGVLAELDYPADLLWASRSIHHLGDQGAALAACVERLAPGGTLAVMEGGLSSRFLPRDIGIGRPGLQARIDAVEADRFTRMREELPGSVAVVEDWPALLTAAACTTPARAPSSSTSPPPFPTVPAPTSPTPSPAPARCSASIWTPTTAPRWTASSTRTTRRASTTARTSSSWRPTRSIRGYGRCDPLT